MDNSATCRIDTNFKYQTIQTFSGTIERKLDKRTGEVVLEIPTQQELVEFLLFGCLGNQNS